MATPILLRYQIFPSVLETYDTYTRYYTAQIIYENYKVVAAPKRDSGAQLS